MTNILELQGYKVQTTIELELEHSTLMQKNKFLFISLTCALAVVGILIVVAYSQTINKLEEK